MAETAPPTREALVPLLRGALDFAGAQARRTVMAYPDYYPMYTVGGRWNQEGERWTHWCEGFFPGILWLLHKATGEAEWRRWAEDYSRPLEPRRHDRTVHDLGFIFFSTYLRWYRLTRDPALREVLIEAGRTLALRRQRGGWSPVKAGSQLDLHRDKPGFLASFVGPQSLFIDVMMNVGLIFWAANETGDEVLREIALEHCRTTQLYLVRPDGGTVHEGLFDVKTGEFQGPSTHQGWSAGSAWSRGVAWAIYGFTAAHRLSGEAEFLDTAVRCADFYLRRAPAGLVPYWDFDLPDDAPHWWDSSAGAITASGLWDLSEKVQDPAARERYRGAALTILQTLCSDTFLARSQPEWEGILLHGVYHYHKNLGVDESVIWGDHFFVEALVKALTGRSEAGW